MGFSFPKSLIGQFSRGAAYQWLLVPYFIEVSFEGVSQPQLKLFLNKIPTSFKLQKDQVDALIENGKKLLRADPEFQQLLKDIANS